MLGAVVYEKAVDEAVHVEAEKWPRREGNITQRTLRNAEERSPSGTVTQRSQRRKTQQDSQG
jgi:hypothetical protein